MTNLLAVLALGFFLGMRHATDPDHVVAVTTLVAQHRSARRAAAIGALWGVGHTITIVAVGSAILLLGWVIPPRLGLSLELSVALMLVLLGAANLASALRGVRRATSPRTAASEGAAPPASAGVLRPFAIGVVHGLAGSAAVALLVLAAIGDPRWGVFYLLVFGVGTILGMTLITLAIALPMRYAEGKIPGMDRRIRLATGLVSVALGLFLAYQIAVVGGLFSGTPAWSPE